MAPRRRCPTCGSRQWHKEPSSGLIACSEGHVLQNYRNEAMDADDLGPHALRKRALKSGRKKKEGGSRANPKLYHGARGRYHYFECQQMLLRKQIAALTELWGLPPEFEIMCRDIWALHLSLLPDPPPAAPYQYEQETRDGTEEGVGKEEAVDEKRKEGKERSSDDEEKDEEGAEEQEDPELVELLRENSETSSSSSSSEDEEDDTDGKARSKGKEKQKAKAKGRHVFESPASTIAVLIVACWTMRIPALCRDFTRLIELYELPYLDPIARQLLPGSMVVHLTKHNIQALSPHHSPTTQALHGLASRLSKMLHTSYGIFTPEANAGPMLWRVVSQALGGTPVLYGMTKRIAQVLSLPLTLHHTLAPGLEQRKGYDPTRHIYDNVAPEVGFAGAAIVVLKMVYGLDGRSRVPRDGEDAACGLPRFSEYLENLRKLDAAEEKARNDGIFDARRSDVCMGDLDEVMMDDYLAFAERALIGRGDGDGLLERYFPLRRGNGHETGVQAGDAQTSRQLRGTVVEETPQLRPGEGYRIYRARDIGGTMAADYGEILGRAARWTGVSVEYLGGVVETYERRVVRWWEGVRRRSRDGST